MFKALSLNQVEFIMSLRFQGDYSKLRKYVSRVDSRGSWRDLKYGGKQYRTEKGAVLNWWEKSGKILFQGHDLAALEFEQGFKAIASTKGRLANESTKRPGRPAEGE